MPKNNPKKSSQTIKKLNYFEATGSVGANLSEANTITDKSTDAVSGNMLKNKAESSNNAT